MTDCTVTENNADIAGGIFTADDTTLTLIGCTISLNTAFQVNENGRGGGIFNRSNLTMSGCTVTENQANRGGGIFNDFDGIITFGAGNTVSGNTATVEGPDCFDENPSSTCPP